MKKIFFVLSIISLNLFNSQAQTQQTCQEAGFTQFSNYSGGASGVCIWENPAGSGNFVCSWGNSSINWEVLCRNRCPNSTYYFGSGNSGSDYCVNTIMPLPVELIDFNAVCNGLYNRISWKTNSEFNSDYFNLLTSTDGQNWELITSIQGAGTSDRIMNYEANHYGPSSGNNYYKIQQFDYDGFVSEYGPIGVENGENEDIHFSNCYPNPSRDVTFFQYTGNNTIDPIEIKVINISGEVVSSFIYSSFSKFQSIEIDLRSIQAGYYQVEMIQGDKRESKRVVIL